MPLIHALWYLDKHLLGNGYSDAVVVVDDTPAMAAKIAMSDLRTKVAFLAVSTIKQKDLGNAVGGALKPVRTPVDIFGSLGVCIYVPASRHWLMSYSSIHLT